MSRDLGPKVSAAAYHGKLSKLQRYLEEEDDTLLDCPSVDYADDAGTTPLHAACQEGHEDCIELLLRAGAVVDSVNKDGVTPLMTACENGHKGCAEMLIKAKAVIDKVDTTNSATALHCACIKGFAECVQLLIESHAPVNTPDKLGATALILAAHHGHASCVELLVGAKADEDIEYEGQTALELAESAGHEACVALLERPEEPTVAPQGADADADDDDDDDAQPIGPPRPPSGGVQKSGVSKMLSDLGESIKKSGMKGAEIIAEKEKEFAEMEKETVRLEAEAKLKKQKDEAEAKANAPQTSADAKAKANAKFSAGKINDAAELYEEAIRLAEEEAQVALVLPFATGVQKATPGAEPGARAVLHCNLAACRLKQRRWRDAVDECDSACDLHPHYTKALFRRAQVRH